MPYGATFPIALSLSSRTYELNSDGAEIFGTTYQDGETSTAQFGLAYALAMSAGDSFRNGTSLSFPPNLGVTWPPSPQAGLRPNAIVAPNYQGDINCTQRPSPTLRKAGTNDIFSWPNLYTQPPSAGLFNQEGRCGQTALAHQYMFFQNFAKQNGADIGIADLTPQYAIDAPASSCADITPGTRASTYLTCSSLLSQRLQLKAGWTVLGKYKPKRGTVTYTKGDYYNFFKSTRGPVAVLLQFSITNIHWMTVVGTFEKDGTKYLDIVDGNADYCYPDSTVGRTLDWFWDKWDVSSLATIITTENSRRVVKNRLGVFIDAVAGQFVPSKDEPK